MNFKQFKKNIGRTLRLSPLPERIDSTGRRLPDIEDEWRLDSVSRRPRRIRLVNIHTHHVVELEGDNLRGYQSPDSLELRCRLIIRSTGIQIKPPLSR